MIGTQDDVTLEEDLLQKENNREINPHHDLNAKEKCDAENETSNFSQADH